MLNLLTALPGSGKSQYAIERFIIDERKANPDRPIYANIKGLRIDALQAMTGGAPVHPSPDDWRTCPDGSLIIYDEAQQRHLFPATGKPGLPDDPRISDFDTHRHRGMDIVLITQDPALVHHWARKFVGRHLHLERPSGAELMTVREWGRAQSNPDDHFAKQDADMHTRRMNPAIWPLYDSATVHTHKFQMPKGAKYAIRVFAAVALLIGLLFGGLAVFGGPDVEAAAAVPPPAASSSIDAALALVTPAPAPAPMSPINGCASGRFCRCWNFDGEVVPMDDAACRNLAEGYTPMPIDLNLFKSGSSAPEGGGRVREAPPAPGSDSNGVVGVQTRPETVGSGTMGAMQGRMPETLRASQE